MAAQDPSDRERALRLVPVSRETAELLDRYVELLTRWQVAKNLVGPATLQHAWTRHVADSAQLVSLAPDARRWVDLGSGAGFPGLVVACLQRDKPGMMVHLVESNGRKCAFLREAIRALKLPAKVHDGRIEDVVAGWSGAVDVVSARALAPLPDLLRLSRNLLTTGAVGIFPKGQDVDLELTDAAKYWKIQASTVASKTDPKARIVVVESAEPRIVS
ncbi:16S rRNA (guanine(527)-N(7))-methyltransferase RsmG [uncultured Alsobacter sp.]|uniref:16S rRNA (guanine(527)-N(7))-methyltransferase RsmG n=1 Tax=uncultured Alsobacter sp. TaxID=1748258 RepID=UPI0025D3F5A9|nr:16S rRNA (guanine(527)-N(7))-methyltransferase RsmG [uncultured Alsobacter sp.]